MARTPTKWLRAGAAMVVVSAFCAGGVRASGVVIAIPAACAKGDARVVVGGEVSCAPRARVLPKVPSAQTVSLFLFVSDIQGRFEKLGLAAFPSSKLRGHRDPADGPMSTLAPLVAPMARRALHDATKASTAKRRPSSHAAPRQAPSVAAVRSKSGCCDSVPDKRWTGPVDGKPTELQDGWTASTTSSLAANVDGVAGATTITAYVPKDEHGADGIDPTRATISVDVSVHKGSGSSSVGFDFPASLQEDWVGRSGSCPAADGHLRRTVTDHLGLHSSEHGMTPGVDYVNKSHTFTATGTYDATVSDDSKLQETKFTVHYTDETAQVTSTLHGLGRESWRVTVTARATGTIDGQSGTVSLDSLVLDAKAHALGVSDEDANATTRELLRTSTDLYAEIVSRYADQGQKRLKETEHQWQQTDACKKKAGKVESPPSLLNDGLPTHWYGEVTFYRHWLVPFSETRQLLVTEKIHASVTFTLEKVEPGFTPGAQYQYRPTGTAEASKGCGAVPAPGRVAIEPQHGVLEILVRRGVKGRPLVAQYWFSHAAGVLFVPSNCSPSTPTDSSDWVGGGCKEPPETSPSAATLAGSTECTFPGSGLEKFKWCLTRTKEAARTCSARRNR
jgi:hypothetical protein